MPNSSKRFWDAAARENAAWHVANGYTAESAEFFASGVREVDEFLLRAGLTLSSADTLVELGSGVGRMTRHLAELAGRVIATDVSGEMLMRARANLADRDNVEYLEVSGGGDLPIDDASADAVFSYITMQHVPSAAAQERYFAEALRILRPGGWAYIQFRRSGLVPWLLGWAGHLAHFANGHRTLNRAWRGARLSARALLSHATEAVSVEILIYDRRHMWVLARRSIY